MLPNFARDDAAIRIGRRDRNPFGDQHLQLIAFQRQWERRQYLAAAGSQHGFFVDEKRAVAAQPGRISGELFPGKGQVEQVRQHAQGESRIGRSASESSTHRRSLFQVNLHGRQLKISIQQTIGPGGQVRQRIPVHPAGPCQGNHELPVWRDGLGDLFLSVAGKQGCRRLAEGVCGNDFQRVGDLAVRDENGFQIVISVRSFADYGQSQVNLYVRVRNHLFIIFGVLSYKIIIFVSYNY